MLASFQKPASRRRILLAHGEDSGGATWVRQAEVAFGPSGFDLCQARTGPETIRRVEEGGLAAAVVVENHRDIDGLSLLRIIRSVDNILPCWLLTHDTRRQTFEVALSLRVISVFSLAIGAHELADAIRKRLPASDELS